MHWISNRTYDLLNNSYAALVTSGTATLETALFKVPQIVCYKGSAISYHIAKRLIKVDYISLVNLISNKEVVKELIQDELTVEKIRTELKKILGNSLERQLMLKEYKSMGDILGDGGASEKVASLLLKE